MTSSRKLTLLTFALLFFSFCAAQQAIIPNPIGVWFFLCSVFLGIGAAVAGVAAVVCWVDT